MWTRLSLLGILGVLAACATPSERVAVGESAASDSDEALAFGRRLGHDVCGWPIRKVSGDGRFLVAVRCADDRFEVVRTEIATAAERVLATIPRVNLGGDRTTRLTESTWVRTRHDLIDFEIGTPTEEGHFTYRRHFYSIDGTVARAYDWPHMESASLSPDGRWAVAANGTTVHVADLSTDAPPIEVAFPGAVPEGAMGLRSSSTSSNEFLVVHNAVEGMVAAERLVLEPTPSIVPVPNFQTTNLALWFDDEAFSNGRFFVTVDYAAGRAGSSEATFVMIDAKTGVRTTVGRGNASSALLAGGSLWYSTVASAAAPREEIFRFTPGVGVKRVSADTAELSLGASPRLHLSEDKHSLLYLNHAGGCLAGDTARSRLEALATDGSGDVRVVREDVVEEVIVGKARWAVATLAVPTPHGVRECATEETKIEVVDLATGSVQATVASDLLRYYDGFPGRTVQLDALESALFFVSTRPSNCPGQAAGAATDLGIATTAGTRFVSTCPEQFVQQLQFADVLQQVPNSDGVIVETMAAGPGYGSASIGGRRRSLTLVSATTPPSSMPDAGIDARPPSVGREDTGTDAAPPTTSSSSGASNSSSGRSPSASPAARDGVNEAPGSTTTTPSVTTSPSSDGCTVRGSIANDAPATWLVGLGFVLLLRARRRGQRLRSVDNEVVLHSLEGHLEHHVGVTDGPPVSRLQSRVHLPARAS